MGAGKGKSRIVIALALFHFQTTKEDIFIVFSSEGLCKRDQDLMADITKFVGSTTKDFDTRVRFVVGLDQIPPKRKCLVIVDESDYITMKNPVDFVDKTKNKKAKIVCLTATPDDGKEDSLEHILMKLLGYRNVLTEEAGQEKVPVIDSHRNLSSTD